jgi:hypothetical protein
MFAVQKIKVDLVFHGLEVNNKALLGKWLTRLLTEDGV